MKARVTTVAAFGAIYFLWEAPREQREAWQYRAPRFSEPEFPDILKQFDLQKIERFLSAYEKR